MIESSKVANRFMCAIIYNLKTSETLTSFNAKISNKSDVKAQVFSFKISRRS